MDELRAHCEDFLISQTPRIETVVLGDMYNLQRLKCVCLPWLTQNLSEIVMSQEFKHLKKKTLQTLLKEVDQQKQKDKKNEENVRDSVLCHFDRLPDSIYTAIPTCDKRCDLIAKNKLSELLKPIKQEINQLFL